MRQEKEQNAKRQHETTKEDDWFHPAKTERKNQNDGMGRSEASADGCQAGRDRRDSDKAPRSEGGVCIRTANATHREELTRGPKDWQEN